MSESGQAARRESRKRSRTQTQPSSIPNSSVKRSKISHAKEKEDGTLTTDEIQSLGERVSSSPKNYNSVVALLRYAQGKGSAGDAAVAALCRAFSMLIVDGRLSAPRDAEANEAKVMQWLRAKRDEFNDVLWRRLKSATPSENRQALPLVMQLLRAELTAQGEDWVQCWTGDHYFRKLIASFAHGEVAREVAQAFVHDYVNKCDDVRYYTFTVLPQVLRLGSYKSSDFHMFDNVISLVEALDPPAANVELSTYFYDYSKEQLSSKRPPSKLPEYQRQAQKAFSSVFACPLSTDQRKALLRNLSPVIVPWLQTPTHVLDFLTDSFEAGGSTSLLALSGLYEMMTTHNLDYPSFYTKFYSLLDDNLLHSAHRSRFFRLLNEFLGSSHLPATMVASFIKRLSRLALRGPPAAIVATVPWVYNMLQMHPTCTFMIHREPRTDEEKELMEMEGANDPFDMSQPDPVATGAIDSCLWELETLQTHFHPNVASLAKIIGQEFRKQSYNLEDFLDHSYSSLIAGDLGKEMKKPPVVEFEILKQVFTSAEGDDTLAQLMTDILAQE